MTTPSPTIVRLLLRDGEAAATVVDGRAEFGFSTHRVAIGYIVERPYALPFTVDLSTPMPMRPGSLLVVYPDRHAVVAE